MSRLRIKFWTKIMAQGTSGLWAVLCLAHVWAPNINAQAFLPKTCEGAERQLKAAGEAEGHADWLTALASYQEATRITPDCVEAVVNLGVIYNHLNRSEQAIAAFKQAIAQRPQLSAAHLNLGITYFRTTRYEL